MLEGLLVDLVPYGEAFIDREFDWHNGEAWYWATVGDRPIVSKASLARWREERAERHEQRGGHSVLFGIRTKDGKVIGDISMNWVLPWHRLAMLGAAIGEPDYWGGGYGTDALLLIVDYAFDWLDMHKIWLSTMGLNERVQRQMAKVGFTLEARQRSSFLADGQHVDNLIYGLLREDWPGREAVIERIGLRAKS